MLFNNQGLLIDGTQYPQLQASILLQSKEYLDDKIFPVLLPGLEQLLIQLQKQAAGQQQPQPSTPTNQKTTGDTYAQHSARIKDPVHWLAQVYEAILILIN
jgi:hypothetical protein